MGILDWFASDWTDVSGVIPVYESQKLPGGGSTRITFYDAKIVENKETGERKLSHVEQRGTQFIPTTPENIPNMIDAKTTFGMVTQKVYDADYIRTQYGVIDNSE